VTRLALKTYCQRELALLDVPIPLAVLIQRPKQVEAGEQAVVIIEVAASKEGRYTLDRPLGQKRIDHQLHLDVYWVTAEEQAGGAAFDGLLEQIDAVFRQAVLPVPLRDPDSGLASTLVWIGEDIDTQVLPPLLDAALEGLVVLCAEKTLQVREQVVG
jgi:hypothetical protein